MLDPAHAMDASRDILKHYRGRGRNAVYVALQGYDISDLVPLMSELAALPDMQSLNLSNNQIRRLPEDLSALANLETLDLTSNPITSAAAVLRGLYSLPKLKHLRLNLTEDEEEQIVATLGTLESLNGVALSGGTPALGSDGHREMLARLRNDTIPELPEELPRGYRLDSASGPRSAGFEHIPWTNETLAKYQRMYHLVSRVSGPVAFPDQFADFQRLIMTHVRAKTKAEPDLIRRDIYQFHGASLLTEYCFDELVRVSEKYGADLATALSVLFEHHTALVQQASAIMAALQEDRSQKISALQEDLARELWSKERTLIRQRASQQEELVVDSELRNELAAQQSAAEAVSLSKLKTTMDLLIESKRHHDDANASAKLPRETLEQHVYTFHYARTSTDGEIRSQVTELYNAVKKWSPKDVDVAVFGLMLRNDLDEEYWEAHRSLRAILYDAVHSVLTSDGEERSDLAALNGRLSESSWGKVLSTVFPSRDITPYLQAVTRASRRTLEQPLTTSESFIGYRDFVDCVLKANLTLYLQRISPIVREFCSLDHERTGVIDGAQFRALLSVLHPGISTVRANELLLTVDVFGNNVITFSDVARTLVKAERAEKATVAKEPLAAVDPSPSVSRRRRA